MEIDKVVHYFTAHHFYFYHVVKKQETAKQKQTKAKLKCLNPSNFNLNQF